MARLFASWAVAAAVAGCGGGGSDNPAMSRPVGLWNGFTSDGRTATALTLDDGTYWLVYSGVGSPTTIGGFVQGHSSSSSSALTSNDARDFNFEGLPVGFGVVLGRYVARTDLQATFSDAGGSGLDYAGVYDSTHELTPSLAEIAGSYSGSVLQVAGTQAAALAIDGDGTLRGASANGCVVSGTATPRRDAYAYDVTLRYENAACRFAGFNVLGGVAVYDPSTRRLIAASPNAARSDALLFVGTRQ